MNCEAVTEKIQGWMWQRVKDAGVRGVIVGASGGIDSAVVSVLCKRAFDDKVTTVILPCESIDDDGIDAGLVASTFAIDCRTLDLTDTYRSMLKLFPETFDCKLARANLKSRLRMSALYYFSNSMNYLVVGTTNKTEMELGYFTKYGDGGVDIEPIANLYKIEVRELAHYLKVPERVIVKAPSAGLWEGQTDEEEIGMSYDQIDRALKGEDCQDGKLVARMLANQHKHKMPPCCPLEEEM